MIQLLLDTACPRGLVALSRFDRVLASQYLDETLKHAEKLPAAIQACLDEAQMTLNDVDRIVVGQGPGSFVGVRVAMAHAKGIGFALSIPVVGVCTLRAIAANCHASPEFCHASVGWHPGCTSTLDPSLRWDDKYTVYIDARRGELYALDLSDPLGIPRAIKPDALMQPHFTAPGPTAEGMLAASPPADASDQLMTLTPAYVRAPDAKRIDERGQSGT